MFPFPDLTPIGQPDYADALAALGPARDLPLLVLYHGELPRRAFLEKVLTAAGHADPAREVHLLDWPATTPLDLSGLVRELNVSTVYLFGYDLPALGLHFEVGQYFPLAVGGVTYLVADSLEFIEDSKERGDNRAARSLWAAISA